VRYRAGKEGFVVEDPSGKPAAQAAAAPAPAPAAPANYEALYSSQSSSAPTAINVNRNEFPAFSSFLTSTRNN